MMTKMQIKREQMMTWIIYMLRLIDKAINWNFIYDLVEEKFQYGSVMLIQKFIQYLYYASKR